MRTSVAAGPCAVVWLRRCVITPVVSSYLANTLFAGAWKRNRSYCSGWEHVSS